MHYTLNGGGVLSTLACIMMERSPAPILTSKIPGHLETVATPRVLARYRPPADESLTALK